MPSFRRYPTSWEPLVGGRFPSYRQPPFTALGSFQGSRADGSRETPLASSMGLINTNLFEVASYAASIHSGLRLIQDLWRSPVRTIKRKPIPDSNQVARGRARFRIQARSLKVLVARDGSCALVAPRQILRVSWTRRRVD